MLRYVADERRDRRRSPAILAPFRADAAVGYRASDVPGLHLAAMMPAVRQGLPVPASVRHSCLLLVLSVIVGFVVILGVIAFQRDVYNYNTESDYLGGFIPEAVRLLRGEPLEIDFHPPLYPAIIAGLQLLIRDWFATGLLVSLAASLAVLITTLLLLRRAMGPGAAMGGIVALVISPTFVYYSLQATSELFSLALYMAAFLAVYVSVERRSPGSYLVAGLLIGLALLTRTNHVVLLGLLLFYLVPAPVGGRAIPPVVRAKSLTVALAGVGLPLAAWLGFALGTGAPVMPTKNHENLALTYFSGDSRISGDARLALVTRFDSTRAVLTADPIGLVRTYARDFAATTRRLLARDTVLAFPLVAVSLLAWLVLLAKERQKRAWYGVLLLNLAAMYALLNFKMYEHRYYLYLLPFLGAAVGHGISLAFRASDKIYVRIGPMIVVLALVGHGALHGASEAKRLHLAAWATDAQAAGRELVALDAVGQGRVYARKHHVAYYAGMDSAWLPDLATVEHLHEHLVESARADARSTFVFYGYPERRTRPQYQTLATPDTEQLPSLELVARGSELGGWVLYRVLTEQDGESGGGVAGHRADAQSP